MKRYIAVALLILASLLNIPSTAKAAAGFWEFSLGAEYAFEGKIQFEQPGYFSANIPHPIGMGNAGAGDTFESAVLNNPTPGSVAAEDDANPWSGVAWLARMWNLDQAEHWSAGVNLGVAFRPLEGSVQFQGISGKDVIHLGACGCAQVSDWRNQVDGNFKGGLVSAYLGPKLEFKTPINNQGDLFFVAFVDGGASFNWLYGSSDLRETILSSNNSQAEVAYGSYNNHGSDVDFNVGYYGRGGIGIRGLSWGIDAYYKYDSRDTLKVPGVRAELEGGSVGVELTFLF